MKAKGTFKRRIQGFLLRLVLGPRLHASMKSSFSADPRMATAHLVDITVRKDGIERRTQADWIKELATILR